MSQKRVISDLKASSERVGRLHPILMDKRGKVIIRQYCLAADENWSKLRLESAETEEQPLIAKLISITCRRHMVIRLLLCRWGCSGCNNVSLPR